MGEVRHGTRVAYVYHRCRCDTCRQENREYHRGYMKKNPGKNAEYCRRYKERLKKAESELEGVTDAA